MGERLRSLDQTHSDCGWNLVEIVIQVQTPSPNSIEDQRNKIKKICTENWKVFVT